MWTDLFRRLALGAMLVLAMMSAASAEQTFTPNDPNCRNTGNFERWLDGFRKDARAAGISAATINSALGGMTLDPGIIARDRKQGFFAQTFTAFSGKLISQNRLNTGIAKLKQHRDLLAKVEQQYGVPGPVITAFWALESDFGVGMGNLPVLRSLATLAYDCRRGDMFRVELMAALQIVDRGDLTPGEMIGSWAGELGQTQFLPTHYLAHAVDFDGDGRRDLLKSVPDVVASTGAFIKFLGWEAGQPWLQEVRVPGNLPWDQADLAIQLPRSKWVSLGVAAIDGKPMPADNLPASLLLPMGRFGPAFLAYPNFQVYLKWNQSLNYSITAAHLAARLAGAPAMSHGTGPIPELTLDQAKELQRQLARRGYFAGEVDGKIGAETRAAVKKAQLQFGFPADSYPTPELLARLGGTR
jgi:lytic murein transglycosylase